MTGRLAVCGLCCTLLGGMGVAAAQPAPSYVVTVQPLAAILREVAREHADIVPILPPGASPHTYEPRPSDARRAASATALLYVSPLLDGWASKLPARRTIEVIALVPRTRLLTLVDADEPAATPGAIDPHFWTDPLTVKSLLPHLVHALCGLDRSGCGAYVAGARRFRDALERLHREVRDTLAPVRGRAVVLFHPSFQYLLARYGLVMVGSIEPSPGKEPTPRYLEKVVRAIRQWNVRSVFTEPQLPARPAEIVSETAGVSLHLLDPNGGVPGRETYAGLIRYNAGVLREALE